MNIILVFIYSIISSYGMVLIRVGGLKSKFEIYNNNINVGINISLLIGAVLYLVSFFLWMIILQKFKLTYISPIVYGLTFICTSIFSYYLLGEVIHGVQYLGVIFIILGVIITSLSRKNDNVK